MRESWKNTVSIVGKVQSFSSNNDYNNLQMSISKKGVSYIHGTLNVSVSDDNKVVIPIFYTYVPETFKSGRTNSMFTNLKKLLDENHTVESVGNDDAAWVRVAGTLGVNDFYSERNSEFVAAPRVEGSFIHDTARGSEYEAMFEADTIITGVTENEDTGVVSLKSYIFNFRNDIIPVTFEVHGDDGQSYFLAQDISAKNPRVTNIWGSLFYSTVIEQRQQEDSVSFGARPPKKFERSVHYWDVEGAGEPDEFGDDSVITKVELKKAIEERQERLEADKARSDEYRRNASHGGNAFNGTNTESAATTSANDDEDDDDDFPW